MKLATLRNPNGTTAAVRVDGTTATRLGASDVGSFLAQPNWRDVAEAAAGGTVDLGDAVRLDAVAVVPFPAVEVAVAGGVIHPPFADRCLVVDRG